MDTFTVVGILYALTTTGIILMAYCSNTKIKQINNVANHNLL